MSQLNNIDVQISTKCIICIESFSTTNVPYQIKSCKHIYHDKCLQDHLEQCGSNGKSHCPLCRTAYLKDDVIIAKELIHVIIKQNLKRKVKLQLLDNTSIQITVDQSQTVGALFKQIPIGLPVMKFNLVIDNKTITFKNDADKLIFDLGLDEGHTITIEENKEICVFVKILQDSTNLTLYIVRELPITEFYVLVSKKTGIPVEQCRYTANGKNIDLKPGKTIADYAICNNTTVHQLLRLKGGI